jgi:tagatose-6-phosphate ketose/aldose isomerase
MNVLGELLELAENEKTERGLSHTPAEIAQQPATWESTFALFRRRCAEISEFLSAAGVAAADFGLRPAVFLIGAGTSDYVGQSLAYLLRRMWQCEVAAVPSTDLVTHADELILPWRHQLWISFSRSGDSPEGVAVLQEALEKRPNVVHLIVCCNAKGRMLSETAGHPRALGICLDDAVNDRGLAMTSSFTNMTLFGQCLAHVDDLGPYEEILGELIPAGQSFLPVAAECAAELATMPFTKVCLVGSGALRAVARESALKVLELTAGKTPTMSESALGLRHGPMAALDKDTLFVSLVSGSERVQKFEMDLLEEIGKKGLVRSRVAVGGQLLSRAKANSVAEYCLAPATPLTVGDDYRPLVDVMFGQLLGLFFSLRWNLRPDSPSPNGAISRVVQNVNIHA